MLKSVKTPFKVRMMQVTVAQPVCVVVRVSRSVSVEEEIDVFSRNIRLFWVQWVLGVCFDPALKLAVVRWHHAIVLHVVKPFHTEAREKAMIPA